MEPSDDGVWLAASQMTPEIGGVEQVELMARAVLRSMDPVLERISGWRQPLSFDGSGAVTVESL